MASEKRSARIAVFGGHVVDHIVWTKRLPAPGETYQGDEYHRALGGKGANSAVAAQRNSHKSPVDPEADEPTIEDTCDDFNIVVSMHGCTGPGQERQEFLKMFAKNGIGASGVKVGKAQTSASLVINDEESGENRILYVAGATKEITEDDFKEASCLGDPKPDLIITQLEIDSDAVEQLIETAGKAEVPVVFNAAPAQFIDDETFRFVTHLLVNQTEAATLSNQKPPSSTDKANLRRIAEIFLKKKVQNVVITLGVDGAFWATGPDTDPRFGNVRAFRAEVRDPTGAGDTFTGVYASEYLRQRKEGKEWDIEKAIKRACKASAIIVSEAGALDGIPWSDKIDDFVGEQYPEEETLEEETATEDISVDE